MLGYRGIDRVITDRKEAEEKLLQSEERFFKVFDLNPAAMAITTLDGRFTHVNHSFERLTGYRSEEALGKTGIELGLYVHGEDREKIIGQLKTRQRNS